MSSKNAVNVRVYNLHILLVQNLNFNRFEAYYKWKYAKVPRAYDDLKTALPPPHWIFKKKRNMVFKSSQYQRK